MTPIKPTKSINPGIRKLLPQPTKDTLFKTPPLASIAKQYPKNKVTEIVTRQTIKGEQIKFEVNGEGTKAFSGKTSLNVPENFAQIKNTTQLKKILDAHFLIKTNDKLEINVRGIGGARQTIQRADGYDNYFDSQDQAYNDLIRDYSIDTEPLTECLANVLNIEVYQSKLSPNGYYAIKRVIGGHFIHGNKVDGYLEVMSVRLVKPEDSDIEAIGTEIPNSILLTLTDGNFIGVIIESPVVLDSGARHYSWPIPSENNKRVIISEQNLSDEKEYFINTLTTTNPSSIKIDKQIRAEVSEIAKFYKVDQDPYFLKSLSHLNFATYTELVLGKNEFEIVVGGIGQKNQLMHLAYQMNTPVSIMNAFDKLTNRFPNKMLYGKFCVNKENKFPSMYSVMVEPWSKVIEFLNQFEEFKSALPDLVAKNMDNGMCFLLGFTMDTEGKHLIVKEYHLFDRNIKDPRWEQPPTFTSYRIMDNKIRDKTKYYTFGVSWEQAKQIGLDSVVKAVDIIPSNIKLMSEITYEKEDSTITDKKIYILRHDSRGNIDNVSFYDLEGIRFLEMNDYNNAIKSFTNSISCNPDNAISYNNRSLAYTYSGDYNSAIKDCLKAMSFISIEQHTPHKEYLAFLYRVSELTQELAIIASPEAYNERGILFFSRKMFEHAKHDFSAAISLDESFAQAHNNLGGTYISMGLFAEAFEHCGIAITLDDAIDNTNYNVALQQLQNISN